MRALLLIIPVISLCIPAFGQQQDDQHSIYVEGIVKEMQTMTPVPFAELTVVHSLDTLLQIKANAEGHYRFSLDVHEGDQLEVYVVAKHHDPSRNLLVVGTPTIQNYTFDIELVYQTVSHTPPRILFEFQSVAPIPFDPTLYLQLLQDNPEICVSITHTLHPDESEKIAKKRLLKFESFLIDSGFPMKQIDLKMEPRIMRCGATETCLAELFFEITSLEGHCLQE